MASCGHMNARYFLDGKSKYFDAHDMGHYMVCSRENRRRTRPEMLAPITSGSEKPAAARHSFKIICLFQIIIDSLDIYVSMMSRCMLRLAASCLIHAHFISRGINTISRRPNDMASCSLHGSLMGDKNVACNISSASILDTSSPMRYSGIYACKPFPRTKIITHDILGEVDDIIIILK